MNEATNEYDDLLDDTEHRWRNRLIMVGVLLALLVAGIYALWTTVLSGEGSSEAVTQTATVERGAIINTVSTSGTAVAQSTASLSFGQSGEVTAVNVTVGQAVKQGDILAEVEADTLRDSLTKAQVNLSSAQTKLNQLLEGSTMAELASADQSLIQAQANLEKANTALQELYNPTSDAVNSAQQAVLSAQSQLTKAQQARADLDSTWDDQVAAAERAVDKAETALDKAERAADNAAADYDDCQASPPVSDPTCRDALANKENTADAVDSAEDDLNAAEDDLDELRDGPSSEDITVADTAVALAQLALQSANDNLAALSNPSADDVLQAQHSLDAAAAALTAAQAKRNETYQGADQDDVASQRDQVRLAQLAVDQAERELDDAKLIAPFDGTVAELNISVGDTVGAGGSTSATVAIVLNTPDAIVIDLTISESDLPNVEVGLSGTASFDAITGRIFPIVIDSVGTNPTTNQGVVTYEARARIVTGQGARGSVFEVPESPPQASSQAEGEAAPDAAGAAVAADAAPTPVPGMNATITIIVDQRQDVLMVLSNAVQRDGRDSVVDIQNEDGSTTRHVVETGLTDGTNTEITSGLEEGQIVIIPTLEATTSTGSQSSQDRVPVFGGPGGAPPGGD